MRQTAGALNRTWLVIVGFVLLLAGAAAILQASGILQQFMTTVQPQSQIVRGDLHRFFDQPLVYISLLAAAIVLGLLALWWIAAQVPRKNTVSLFRLQDDRSTGITTINPGTLAEAVKAQCEQLGGVLASSVVIRGTALLPELVLEVKVGESTDIRLLTDTLREALIPSLETALEVPLAIAQVKIDVVKQNQNTGIHVTPNAPAPDEIRLSK